MSVPHVPMDKVDGWKREKFKGGEIEGELENIKLKLAFY